MISSAAFLLSSQQAFSAGYSTSLYSTSGLGNSYAGSVTGVHDASDLFFNPAISANLKKGQFILSVSQLKMNIDADQTDGSKYSGADVHDAGVDAAIPALYLTAPISSDTTFGLAITSPFGLATEYNDNWSGRYNAIKSSISTININPSLSYKINDEFSIGAGFQAQYYKATLTKAGNLGGGDFTARLKGDDWGYGYNLGATYQPNDQLKFGLGYRSKIDHKLVGETDVPGLVSGFDSKTSTPESLTAGVAFKPTKFVELAYDMTWTAWSRLKHLSANAHQNPNLSTTEEFNWHDSFLHSVGANFTINDKWLLRTGVAYEKDAVTQANREPRVPSGDKVWTSFGFNYKIKEDLSFDAAYVHQFFKVARMNVDNDLQVKYKTRVDVFSLALKKEF